MTNDQRPITNSLTIDVEDYFHVSAFETVCAPDTWDRYETRVDANTRKILDLLAEFETKASFFVLGWVAERFPSLVKEIVSEEHEVASHGYGHRRVYTQTREEFREDARRSKGLLEDLTGTPVLGYRAPSYSISRSTLWAYDELLEAGYVYDSSVFPIRHDLYGLADWPRFPFSVERLEGGNWVPAEAEPPRLGGSDARTPGRLEANALRGPRAGMEEGSKADGSAAHASGALDGRPSLPASQHPSLLEIPITTLRLAGRSFPIAGGGYFRLFPYPLTRWGLRRINEREGRPFVFYVHPWELDPRQPRISGAGLKSRFRHYLNLAKTESRFRSLLSDFRFAPMREALGAGAGVCSAAADAGRGGAS